jgi:hypothetical protein
MIETLEKKNFHDAPFSKMLAEEEFTFENYPSLLSLVCKFDSFF